MNIIITGTSRGIGEALAIENLENGATVYGVSRTCSEKLTKYPNYQHLTLDLSKSDNLMEEFKRFIGKEKTFNLVILNAGVLSEIKDMLETSMEEINTVMQVNVWSNKEIIDALFKLKHKVEQLVAISSGAAVSGARGWNSYSISKSALNMMISLYSKELPQTHFSSLAPGVIDTDMQEYIYNLPIEKSYPVIQRLKEMRKNGEMPDPGSAAKHLIKVMPVLMQYESGSFLDIRDF